MITLNDMMEQGIVLQGDIKVMQYDEERDDYFTVFSNVEINGLYHRIDEQWADLPISYIYTERTERQLVIEVGRED